MMCKTVYIYGGVDRETVIMNVNLWW